MAPAPRPVHTCRGWPPSAAGWVGLVCLGAVPRYLEKVDPEAARIARVRYGCLAIRSGAV